jgi:protein-tyrosine phosphatase
VIDIHCHILPEVDDGPKSWDTSIEMCRIAAADGISHIVATPHANDRYHYDRPYLASLLERLRELSGGQPALSLGCDFHLDYDNLQNLLADPARFTIEGGRYLLIELSNYAVPTQLADVFRALADKSITCILTHPERNSILQQSPQRLLEWVEQGCMLQVTASSLEGAWGSRALKTAHWLLEREAVHALATDAHDTRHRVPRLSAARDAVAQLCGPQIAHALVDANPRAIIEARPLPYFPTPVHGS